MNAMPKDRDRNSQVGGSHYADSGIQPFDIYEDELTPGELAAVYWSHVIRYVKRWRSKNGETDLFKALDYLNMLISLVGEYPELQRKPNTPPVRKLREGDR